MSRPSSRLTIARLVFLLAFLGTLGLVVFRAANAAAPGPVILAVHPYLPEPELQRRYGPLADYLQTLLNRRVEVRVGKDYNEHVMFIGKDQVDIAFMGPATYIRLTDKYGPKPLLARLQVNGKPLFHGYIVTSSGSGVTDLTDLRGRRFAFGDPASTMSHLVPRYMMLEAGIDVSDLADYQFLGSHRNVALGVLTGDFDAGAVKEEVFRAFRSKGLRAVARSPAFSEHLFVARANAPPDFVSHVAQALFQLSTTAHGKEILSSIKDGVTGMAPVDDRDYDNLRAVLRELRDRGVQ